MTPVLPPARPGDAIGWALGLFVLGVAAAAAIELVRLALAPWGRPA